MDDQILGEIVRVKVTAAKPYDLIAELIEEETDAAAPELTAVGGSH
jgi:hypothetical protein